MVLLIMAVVWGYKMTPTTEPCVSLEYIIEDSAERMYLTEAELNQLLLKENLYPVGHTLNLVSLHRIEAMIQHHPMVRNAECYLTPRNEVKVRLTQREPLLRVETAHEHYLIDTDRRVMEAKECVKDSVLLVSGNVNPQTAATQLTDFALWLQTNRYWRTRIDHMYMQSPQIVYVYQHNQPRILLGSMYGCKRKLEKMRQFYENADPQVLEKEYKEYDVRFRGQIIGKR